MKTSISAAILVSLLAGTGITAAQSVDPRVEAIGFGDTWRPAEISGAPGPPARAEKRVSRSDLTWAAPRLSASEIHTLGPLSREERAALSSAMTSGDRLQVGISRSFAVPIGFDLTSKKFRPASGDRFGGGLLEVRSGQLSWTAGFVSVGAGAVRLRMEELALPDGTVAFVYSRSGELHGPYAIGGSGTDLVWTNSVFSDEVFLEIQFPRGFVDLSSARLSVAAIAHLEHDAFAPPLGSAAKASPEALASCFKDLNCVAGSESGGLADASRAVAQMLFESNGAMYVCSGALVNTTAGNAIPYFLTANHCISSAASARSLETFWDYRTASCDGPVPNRSGFRRTLGATLLATGSVEGGDADFSLLLLSQEPPAGRYYLGWSSLPVASEGGTRVLRVAHPEGGPQMFSSHVVSAVPEPGECSNLPHGRFLYSKNEIGATKGGSSGSPALLEDGLKIAGQLFGRCGNNIPDACDAVQNSSIDGAFANYFAKVERWLSPSAPAPCVADPSSLCLLGSRFRVELTARDSSSGKSEAGVPIPESDVVGYFALPALTGQTGSPEVFVKILDGRQVTGKFWVFYGGLTHLEFTLKVTDTVTGKVKSYRKVAGSFCGSADTQAF